MQRKLSVRIIASLILSVMLFALPVGAFIANSSTAVSVYAEESVTGNEAGTTDDSSSSDDASDRGSTDEGTDTTVENPSSGDNSDAEDTSNTGDSASENESGDGEDGGETGEDDPTPTPEPTPEPEPECICDHKCSQYDYNKDCPVCSQNYKDCAYKEPSVKITINTPSGWYSSGTSAKVTFKVEDILDTGNFAIKSVKAKIGQNGSYNDVTEDMFLEISENCTVYVLVTDANDKSYERSRSIKCFDTSKPTLNAAVSDGLLTIQASDNDSGVKVIYVNGYEFTDVTNGTVNIRLSQFDAVHEDQYGKGMWMKLPADGHTTVRKDHCVGEGADGKKIWETEKTKVSNRDLKGMVEFYKSRGKEQEEKPRESLKDRLSEKKAEVSQQKHDAPQKTATKSKEASL